MALSMDWPKWFYVNEQTNLGEKHIKFSIDWHETLIYMQTMNGNWIEKIVDAVSHIIYMFVYKWWSNKAGFVYLYFYLFLRLEVIYGSW